MAKQVIFLDTIFGNQQGL